MSEIANSEGASESEKPVSNDGVIFPPFPDPNDDDFDDDIEEEERSYYKTVFKDLNTLKSMRLHCTACDRHLGCAARNESRMRAHPMLRTLVCHTCHIFYNSGEFEKGDDGSELYCRWCGQGGQVFCCSDCPHVFCAKCVKRNFGMSKAKEIENIDDWKCFKCNNKCLWDLRALCWAVLRFCDLKNKMAHQAQDPELKEAYKKDCSVDYSECCKSKTKRNQKTETPKRKEIKKESDVKSNTDAKTTSSIISKISPTIQVKKFASVNIDEVKQEKKPQKRSLSPKNKAVLVKNPINIAPNTKLPLPPLPKRMKLPPLLVNSTIRVINDRNKPLTTYTRIKPKTTQTVIGTFNGINPNIYSNDNINLSLESLTQGLDMSTVAALTGKPQEDDVVCTPDFPLEPLCEVTEDNDDDVQCITPGPVVPPKLSNPPPLVPRLINNQPVDVTSDNVVQMTDNDVTVNTATGGLKFRVDPQTLSSNKMYRLPDGRIFAINSNPAMPGGYSATIVAVAEATGKTISKGATYAAKLSSVAPSPVATPKATRNVPRILKRSTPKATISKIKPSEVMPRNCDLNVPVEWYRYNLVDAVDALEYALSRLNKLKKEATTVFLRTRTIDEMRTIHRSFERLLNTSSSRFTEIRDNLNKGFKQYLTRKSGGNSEDDDDVEILPDMEVNDDPIFIDENSIESINGSENQEVDLTSVGSEYNDSEENNKSDNFSKSVTEPLNDNEPIENSDSLAVISHKNNSVNVPVNAINKQSSANDKVLNSDIVKETERDLREDNKRKSNVQDDVIMEISENASEKNIQEQSSTVADAPVTETENDKVNKKDNMDIDEETDSNTDTIKNDNIDKADTLPTKNNLECTENSERNGLQNDDEGEKKSNKVAEVKDDGINNNDLNDKADNQDSDDRLQDTEMSEEMIETLLKDDVGDEQGTSLKTVDSSEILEET